LRTFVAPARKLRRRNSALLRRDKNSGSPRPGSSPCLEPDNSDRGLFSIAIPTSLICTGIAGRESGLTICNAPMDATRLTSGLHSDKRKNPGLCINIFASVIHGH
jgi:hypothetical protein